MITNVRYFTHPDSCVVFFRHGNCLYINDHYYERELERFFCDLRRSGTGQRGNPAVHAILPPAAGRPGQTV